MDGLPGRVNSLIGLDVSIEKSQFFASSSRRPSPT